jgi:hypothetical protein
MIEIKNSVESRKMFSSIKTLIELNIDAVPSSFNMIEEKSKVFFMNI